jgi:hypothetical protein
MDVITEARPGDAKHAVLTDDHDPATEKGKVVVSAADDIGEGEPQKSYYSKQSVWFMVLFSGLAIGSDG